MTVARADLTAPTGKEGRPRDTATSAIVARSGTDLRTVVIDTSTLLNDPAVLDALAGDHVVVPLPVVLELDGHKRRDDAVGHAAREVIRRLDSLRERGDVRTGVATEPGGTVRMLLPAGPMPDGLSDRVADHLIVAVALQLAGAGEHVTLVSDDGGLRVVASYYGLHAVGDDPVAAEPARSSHPTGWDTLQVTDADIDRLWHARHDPDVDLADLREQIPHPNGYALLVSPTRQVRARRRGDLVTPVAALPDACGIAPRDHGQAFALDALADLDVPMVALSGAAGSGKTLLAVAVGLAMLARNEVDHVMVLRPITPVDRQDLGFLPGDANEKFAPFTGAVADVLAALPSLPLQGVGRDPLRTLMDRGLVSCAPVTHLRGRTLARTFVVLDEAQNLSIRGVRTVATRIGPGGQLAVVGDPRQVDDPYLSPSNNGLVRLLDAFAGQRLFAHLHLASVQRSDLAAVASELL